MMPYLKSRSQRSKALVFITINARSGVFLATHEFFVSPPLYFTAAAWAHRPSAT